jgi:exocyst complex component 2
MHATADTASLLQGLETLSQSIDQKSASLKVLVESNFERFVRAKAVIDNVYKEMKYRGAEPGPPRARAHSRHASRNSFRNSANGIGLTNTLNPVSDSRKKNALVKESEYGVLGIKGPLLDVSAKAEDVWGPALGGREKEETLKTVAGSLDRFKEYVEISAAISDSIKRKDHESLVEEYTKARRFSEEAKKIAQGLGNSQPSDSQLYQILLAARMWHDVDEQIQSFKRDIWRRLISLHTVSKLDVNPAQAQDQHMELIALLLELGVDDNPVWVWLLSRYDYLKGKISSSAERAKVEIEVLRRRLANAEKPAPQAIASHMRSLGRQAIDTKTPTFDSADIIELWEKMASFMTNLLSSQGVVGEVLDFWQTVESFMDGKVQRTLPGGYNNESQKHHRLSVEGTGSLQKGIVELVGMIRDHALSFFAGPPPEDISLLLSPSLPQSPGTPMASLSGALSPTVPGDPRFDPNNLPPPSPKRGESWEKFAFWPPWSNSISGVHYLSKMLTLVGSGASDMASMRPVAQVDPTEVDRLKTLVGASRERCVTALCAAWNRDAENIRFVEDWNRAPDRGDITKMPLSFSSFEGALLTGMQKILYISDATGKPGAGDIVLPPSAKLLQMVRSQYVTTLYKALSGMVENAERSVKKSDDDWTTDMDGFVTFTDPSTGRASMIGGGTINAGDRVSFKHPRI